MLPRTKYKAQPIILDGIRFASKREAIRYQQLKLLEKAGKISLLQLQPRFDIIINGIKVGFYKADFKYEQDGKIIIEDCKGYRTPIYRLKKKLVQALYGITICER